MNKLYYIITSNKVDNFIMGIIGINILIMSLYNDNMSSDLDNFLTVSNYVFIGFYTVEFILKVLGLSP